MLTLVAGTVKSKAGCRRSIYLKPCCRPLPAVLCLQVKPLEGSLANVNGRGCNESAAGEEEAAPAPGHESLLCAAARAAAAITLLSAHPPATQRPAPQLFRLPSCACHAHCPAGASHALPACLPACRGGACGCQGAVLRAHRVVQRPACSLLRKGAASLPRGRPQPALWRGVHSYHLGRPSTPFTPAGRPRQPIVDVAVSTSQTGSYAASLLSGNATINPHCSHSQSQGLPV